MRTTRTRSARRQKVLFLLLFLALLLIPAAISSTAQADSAQGYTIQAEHGINFVGDTMNISATGHTYDFVTLIFSNSSGNTTYTFILQLNYNGTGTAHIRTDDLKPDTYTVELGVRNLETQEINIVANTTVTLVYDPIHIMQKHINEQDGKILQLMKDNEALKNLYITLCGTCYLSPSQSWAPSSSL